jgi:hypothetical protein
MNFTKEETKESCARHVTLHRLISEILVFLVPPSQILSIIIFFLPDKQINKKVFFRIENLRFSQLLEQPMKAAANT